MTTRSVLDAIELRLIVNNNYGFVGKSGDISLGYSMCLKDESYKLIVTVHYIVYIQTKFINNN